MLGLELEAVLSTTTLDTLSLSLEMMMGPLTLSTVSFVLTPTLGEAFTLLTYERKPT